MKWLLRLLGELDRSSSFCPGSRKDNSTEPGPGPETYICFLSQDGPPARHHLPVRAGRHPEPAEAHRHRSHRRPGLVTTGEASLTPPPSPQFSLFRPRHPRYTMYYPGPMLLYRNVMTLSMTSTPWLMMLIH